MNIDETLMNSEDDITCLGDGAVYPASFEKTGLNKNELIIATTGCGKTFSIVYPKMLHCKQSSLVVPIVKSVLKEKFSKMFLDMGYQVLDLDFTSDSSPLSYDPLDYIKTDEDIYNLATRIVNPLDNKYADRFWDDTVINLIGSLIGLVCLKAEETKEKANFSQVLDLFQKIEYTENRNGVVSYNIQKLFDSAEKGWPGNYACKLWKSILNLPVKTACTVISSARTSLNNLYSPKMLRMFSSPNHVRFKDLGEKKSVLFITTSPVNTAMHTIVNLLYEDLFKELFEEAEHSPNYTLNVPVHIIADDFAVGTKIRGFEDYISVFRAAGISCTLLLQSESQLITMYGEHAARTIINNVDTLVFMGGMDVKTCQTVSTLANLPLYKIMSMPLGQEIIFRRGSKPIITQRYKTLEDREYIRLMDEKEPAI